MLKTTLSRPKKQMGTKKRNGKRSVEGNFVVIFYSWKLDSFTVFTVFTANANRVAVVNAKCLHTADL